MRSRNRCSPYQCAPEATRKLNGDLPVGGNPINLQALEKAAPTLGDLVEGFARGIVQRHPKRSNIRCHIGHEQEARMASDTLNSAHFQRSVFQLINRYNGPR